MFRAHFGVSVTITVDSEKTFRACVGLFPVSWLQPWLFVTSGVRVSREAQPSSRASKTFLQDPEPVCTFSHFTLRTVISVGLVTSLSVTCYDCRTKSAASSPSHVAVFAECIFGVSAHGQENFVNLLHQFVKF